MIPQGCWTHDAPLRLRRLDVRIPARSQAEGIINVHVPRPDRAVAQGAPLAGLPPASLALPGKLLGRGAGFDPVPAGRTPPQMKQAAQRRHNERPDAMSRHPCTPARSSC